MDLLQGDGDVNIVSNNVPPSHPVESESPAIMSDISSQVIIENVLNTQGIVDSYPEVNLNNDSKYYLFAIFMYSRIYS